ncbi:hypothetical protein CPB83DRAFT_790964 [Crepidotus variabilis]|uniref:Uncharacterized protein n=1 Tax=Crepidotus variabilis TaxID=179855 RepID=A0A9P6JQ11_9AGAR|nr:hypothetical protein CPB83DRAFT_790964 [Crepidotus variabilis]
MPGSNKPEVTEAVPPSDAALNPQRHYSDSRPTERVGEQASVLSPATTSKTALPPGLVPPGSRRFGSELGSWLQSRSGVELEGGQSSKQKSFLNERSAFGLAGGSRSHSRGSSPEEYRHSVGHWLNCVPEDSVMSVERSPITRPAATPSYVQHSYYGSLGYPSSVEVEQDEELSEAEEEWLVDEELAKDGLYRGNYKNLVLLYTFVPSTTVIAFIILAVLPVFAFRSRAPLNYPYPPYLPFPFPEVLTSAALWALSYLLRDTLYACCLNLASYLPFSMSAAVPAFGSVLASILQTASTLILRQLAVPLLLVSPFSTENPPTSPASILSKTRHTFPTWKDAAFQRVWWIALGWAAAEAFVGIKQGYENVTLYKDVLVSVHRGPSKPEGRNTEEPRGRAASSTDDGDTPTQRNYSGHDVTSSMSAATARREHSSSLSSRASSAAMEDLSASAMLGENQPLLTLKRPTPLDATPLTRRMTNESERMVAENEVEHDFDALMRLKSREELEEVYGIPFIRIPVFISCLHRINSILSSLGVCLLLSGAYLRSTLAIHQPATKSGVEMSRPFEPSNRSLIAMFWSLLLLQTVMSLMHTSWILPRIGIHTFVYVGLLVWLGVFFGALGYWEVLS